MHRYQVFKCELADGAAGYKQILAEDAYEAEQIVEQLRPGAVMGSVDGELEGGEATKKAIYPLANMV